MKNYELAYLISPDLSEEELKSLQEKISSLIQDEGGVLTEIPGSNIGGGTKSLAYPIKKKTSTFFAILNFQLSPERLENIEKKLKSEGRILRYIIFAKPQARVMEPGKPPRVKIRKIIPKPKPKVELKEIEKKLEEILEE